MLATCSSLRRTTNQEGRCRISTATIRWKLETDPNPSRSIRRMAVILTEW